MPRALWQDPYAAQTIDLLQEPARARAAAVQKIAEAQARAAEISGNANANAQLVGGNAAAGAQIAGGNAWAGAIDNTARAVASIPGQIQQARAQSQADQLAKLQIAQRQQQMDASQRLTSGQSTLAGAMMTSADPSMQPQGPDLSTPNGVVPQTPNFLKPDENGVHTWDIEGISKYMAAKGFGDLNPTFIKDVDGLNQAMRQESAARAATLRNIADMSYRSGNNRDIANKLVDTLKANNFYPPDELEHIRGTIGTPAFDQLVDGLRTPDKPITVAKGAILTTEERAAKGLPPLVSNEEPPPDYTINGQRFSGKTNQPAGPAVPKQESPSEVTLRQAQLAEITAKLNGTTPLSPKDRAELEIQRAKLANDEAAPVLTPEALSLTAHQFAMTGQLPPMGMGKTGASVRTAIINKAADEYKGLDLPTQVAAYNANKNSLKTLQATTDKVSAFESTAGKNLDQFLSLADKIPDTGVPWLNAPIRSLDARVLGSDGMAAANAARDVALREIARVTNDPNLSGVLSDSARREVSSLSPADATFAQIKSVAKVLKQDMANVHSSLNDQIQAVQQRIATPPTGTAPKVLRYNPATGKVE